ncbi:MAG: polysaccharide biosynthesis C-terminal domain-containing protein [Acidobacteriota bacterium]
MSQQPLRVVLGKLFPADKRLLREGGWVGFGVVASGLGMLVGVRLLTELVPPSVFGTVALITGILAFSSQLFCMPQLNAVSRFYPEYVRSPSDVQPFRARIGRSLYRTLAALTGCVLLGGAVAVVVWRQVSYLVFVVAACLLAVEVLRLFEMNLLNAARRQRPYALWQAAESWSRPLLAILVVVLWGAKPESVLVGYCLATLGGLVLFRIALGTPAAQQVAAKSLTAEFDREMRRFALPLVPLAVVSWLHSAADRYLLGALLDMHSVGLYVSAYGLVNRLMAVIPQVLLISLRPVLFEAVSSETKDERRVVRLWLGTAGVALGLGCLVLWLASDLVVALLLASTYREAAALLPVLGLGFSFLFMSQIFNTVSLAYKHSKAVLYSELGAATVALVGGVALILSWGLSGAAIATAMAYFVQLVLSYRFARAAKTTREAVAA